MKACMRWPEALRLSPRGRPTSSSAPSCVLFAVFGLFPLGFSLYWPSSTGSPPAAWTRCSSSAWTTSPSRWGRVVLEVAEEHAVAGLGIGRAAAPGGHPAGGVHPQRLVQALRDGVMVGAYFLPYITSTVAIAIMFSSLFSTDFGLINAGLERADFGVAGPSTGWAGPRPPSSRRSPSSCSGASWASTPCSTWPRCRPSRRTCTKPPRWTAPAAGSSSCTSRCRA
jgi:hypothetical protein